MKDRDDVTPMPHDEEDGERQILVDVKSLLDQLHLDARTLSLDSDLSNDLGVDSLALVELCDLLERSFDVTLPDEVFLTATTPRQWLTSIQRAKGNDDASVSSPFEAHDREAGSYGGALARHFQAVRSGSTATPSTAADRS
jgi:acyl carrier protein